VTRDDLPPLDDEPDDPRFRPAPRRAAPPAAGAGSRLLSDQPLSLDPSGTRDRAGASPEPYDFRRPYGAAPPGRAGASASGPDASSPYDFSPEPYEHRQVIGAPKSAPRTVPRRRRPRSAPRVPYR